MSKDKTKIIKEAVDRGLEFIRIVNKGKAYEYRFIDCGHTQVMQHGNVMRNEKVTCYTCVENNLKKLAESNGLTLLPKDGDCKMGFRKYVFNSCGHTTLMGIVKLRKPPKCKTCMKLKHEQEANRQGLTILKNTVKGKVGYKLYRRLECGHELELATTAVRIADFSCKKCSQNDLVKHANEAGLTLLGDCPTGNKTKRLYRFNECGHIRSIQTYQVRNKAVICDECEKYYWNKPSSLYIMHITVGTMSWLKIGFSNNIDFRIKRYGLENSAVIDILFTHEFESGKLVNSYESALHEKLKSFKLSNNFMQQYHTQSGFTECFECSDATAINLAIEVCNTAL